MHKLFSGSAIALTAMLAFAAPSLAGPLTMANIVASTGGTAKAYYIGSGASDTNTVSVMFGSAIFTNNGEGKNQVGDKVSLGTFAVGAEIKFRMVDSNPPNTWFTGAGSRNADGLIHALVTLSPASFTNLSSRSITYANSFAAEHPGAVFVGFEDRSVAGSSDFDYNDIVFAVTNAKLVAVPEPVSLALLGAGLAGMGLVRRRQAA